MCRFDRRTLIDNFMTDILYKLASSIATEEGYFMPTETLPKKNNNPGESPGSALVAASKDCGRLLGG